MMIAKSSCYTVLQLYSCSHLLGTVCQLSLANMLKQKTCSGTGLRQLLIKCHATGAGEVGSSSFTSLTQEASIVYISLCSMGRKRPGKIYASEQKACSAFTASNPHYRFKPFNVPMVHAVQPLSWFDRII